MAALSKAEIIAKYPGYATMDPNAVEADFAATGGKGKEGGGSSPSSLTTETLPNYLDAYQSQVSSLFGSGGNAPLVRGGQAYKPNADIVGLTPAQIAQKYGGTGSAYAAKLGIDENAAITADQALTADLSDTGSGEVQTLSKLLTSTGGSTAAQTPFSQIKSQLTGGIEAPTPINRTELFQNLREQYGVAETEAQVTDLKAYQRELDAQLRINVAGERGKPVAQNVIEGKVSQQQRNIQEEYDFVSRQIAYKTDQLTTAYNVIGMYINFAGQDYQDAVTRYNTEFEQNLGTINLMRGIRQDAISEQQRQIDNARANLTVYANAITSGNMNYDKMDANQKATVAKLEAQVGLPSGTIANLTTKTSDRILAIDEKGGQALTVDASGAFKVVKTGYNTSNSGVTPGIKLGGTPASSGEWEVVPGPGAKSNPTNIQSLWANP